MPYAKENEISTDPLDGGIEITEEQYLAGIEGIINGQMISIANGFEIVDVPEPETPPVEPPEYEPTVVSGSNGRFIIADGQVSSVGVYLNNAGGFVLEEGKIWIFFLTPLQNTDYSVFTASDGNHILGVSEADRFVDSFILTCNNLAGVPTTPAFFSYEVKCMM